ncbi:hypothetical protein [Streptomyces sp. NPDC018584]|uniref:hypothetical protein n=1 Tax=unclassified Streptomyces TaxID=2593676 RepID=UPI00379FBDEC
MRRRVSRREIVARLEAVEAQLARKESLPLEGQETIPLAAPDEPEAAEDDR